MLDTVVFVDQQAIDYFSNDVLLVKINADSNEAMKKEFHVMGLPTTFIVSPQGKLIARQEGAITREALEAYIDRKNKEMNIGPSAFLLVDQ